MTVHSAELEERPRDHTGAVLIEETADGVRYVLPRRKLPYRWTGWITLAVGLVWLGGALLVLLLLNSLGTVGLMIVKLVIAGLLAGLGCLFLFMGMNTLIGRAELLLQRDRLVRVEITRPFQWSRSRPAHGIRRFVVAPLPIQTGSFKLDTSWLTKVIYGLSAEYDDGRQRPLVKRYGLEELTAIAHDLTRRLQLDAAVHVANAERAQQPGGHIEQPPGSAVVLERTEEGLSMLVPPLGVWKSGDGRTVSQLFGSAVAGAGAGLLTFVMIPGLGGAMWWMWVVFSVPAVAGAFYMGLGLVGQRDTYIDVVHDAMLITTRTWRGVVQHQFLREEIEHIIRGDSFIEVNDEPLPQLHIVPKSGDYLTLFTGRRKDEIEWMAHVLREAMGLDTEKGTATEDGQATT